MFSIPAAVWRIASDMLMCFKNQSQLAYERVCQYMAVQQGRMSEGPTILMLRENLTALMISFFSTILQFTGFFQISCLSK